MKSEALIYNDGACFVPCCYSEILLFVVEAMQFQNMKYFGLKGANKRNKNSSSLGRIHPSSTALCRIQYDGYCLCSVKNILPYAVLKSQIQK